MNKDIDQVFWPTWLAVSQLRDGSEVDDGAAFYRRACQWIDSAREALRDMGYSEHSVEHMLYTQCALLDESVLNRNRQDSGYITWLATPLQARYFNTTNAGEELWERIRTVLREPVPDTPKNIQLTAGHSLTVTTSENADLTLFKRLTVAAGEAISLFAQKMGMKIFAARGMIDIQAQTDGMRLQSDKTMNINSVNGDIVLNAQQGITLTSTGGAYIKIKDGSIELGAPGSLKLKSPDIQWGGVGILEKALKPMTVSDPQYKYPMNGSFQIVDKGDGKPKPYIKYRIETESGETIRGVTDENGYTQSHYGLEPQTMKLFFE